MKSSNDHIQRPSLSPSQLIVERSHAFGRADFGFIFDCFHTESNFRAQFDDRDEYIRYGWSSLGKDFRILRCEIICETIESDEAQVIYLVEMESLGQSLRYAERAWLRMEEGGWRYHRGQKMEEDQLPADPMTLDFGDFEKLSPQVIF